MNDIIQAGKTTTVPFCTEITVLGGVELPNTVRCFDVRCPDDKIFEYRTPWGTTPFSSERAEIVLGLRGPNGQWDACCPLSCQAYEDFRKASESKLASIAHEWITEVSRAWKAYREAQANPSTNGGGCVYKPLALTLANYGWSLISNRHDYVVRK